jgi:UDP-N-acetylmuramoyl-tripeptide--D-alanyl-D-alanine ligase
MIRMTLGEAARIVGGELIGGADAASEFRGVAIDSRRMISGGLFAALPGSRVDGHQFVPAALQKGAAGVLVSRFVPGCEQQLRVTDVQQALGLLARAWRERLGTPIAGITGSNGKTTVKEMLAAILCEDARVLATEGNLNNELGVPLTLFRLGREHDFGVLEMAAAKRGDIRYLGEIVRPDAGMVNNVGPAHLDGFGDLEGVAHGKGEMYASLAEDGCAVFNHDEPWLPLWRDLSTAGREVTFGFGEGADVRPVRKASGLRLHTPVGDCDLFVPLPGEHNLKNALAAASMALAFDIPLEQIRAGLAAIEPVPGRLNLRRAAGGWTVIDDTYNANPASLYAALKVLADQPGERWLVLGDMLELGEDSRKMHAEMGEAARHLGVRRLLGIGANTAAAVEAFGGGAELFEDAETLIEALQETLHPGVACLVKGSRSMAMGQVARAILDGEAPALAGGGG